MKKTNEIALEAIFAISKIQPGVMLGVLGDSRSHELITSIIAKAIESAQSQSEPATVERAYEIGTKGAAPTEPERLLFEAWMRGHNWLVAGIWNGREYGDRPKYKEAQVNDPIATQNRQLFAAWRDRAALGQSPKQEQVQAQAQVQCELAGYFFRDSTDTEWHQSRDPSYRHNCVPLFKQPLSAKRLPSTPDAKKQSFAEKYPRNPNATCKCEHWEACINCHPSYIEAVINGGEA